MGVTAAATPADHGVDVALNLLSNNNWSHLHEAHIHTKVQIISSCQHRFRTINVWIISTIIYDEWILWYMSVDTRNGHWMRWGLISTRNHWLNWTTV